MSQMVKSTWYMVCSWHCTISFCSPKKALFVCLRNQGGGPRLCDQQVAQHTTWGLAGVINSVITATLLCLFGVSEHSCPQARGVAGKVTRRVVPWHLWPQLTSPRSHSLQPGKPQLPLSPPDPFVFSRSICGRAGCWQGRGLMEEEVGWLVWFLLWGVLFLVCLGFFSRLFSAWQVNELD